MNSIKYTAFIYDYDYTWNNCTAIFCRYLEGNVVRGEETGSLECNNTGYFQYTLSVIKYKYASIFSWLCILESNL